MELGGWERAHGYAANEHLLEKYGDRVPVRENEWDNRHFWRVSNAEQLAMSDDCGIVNLSHFAILDVEGPDAVALMEWVCAARIGGDANIGKGDLHPFPRRRGKRARGPHRVPHGRPLPGGRRRRRRSARPRYLRRRPPTKASTSPSPTSRRKIVTIGIWGPNARVKLQKVVRTPTALTPENFPFAAIRPIGIAGKNVIAFRISYVGEQGFELHMAYEDGLAVWDALRSTGAIAVGVETYANTPAHGEEPAAAERRPHH